MAMNVKFCLFFIFVSVLALSVNANYRHGTKGGGGGGGSPLSNSGIPLSPSKSLYYDYNNHSYI